jgi:hypothetical protein
MMQAQGELEGRAFVVARTDSEADGQHVLATGGFGCSPTALGRKVFIRFEDGSQSYTRREFLDEAEPGYTFPTACVFVVMEETGEGHHANVYATATAADAHEVEDAIIAAEGAEGEPRFLMLAYEHIAFGWGGVRKGADGTAEPGGPERRFHILPLPEYRRLEGDAEVEAEMAAAV